MSLSGRRKKSIAVSFSFSGSSMSHNYGSFWASEFLYNCHDCSFRQHTIMIYMDDDVVEEKDSCNIR